MNKDIKIQIALRIGKVRTKDRYGVDKRFVEKIEPGDILVIEGNFNEIIGWGHSIGSWEITITGKGISKTFKSSSSLRNLIKERIVDYEQIDLI